MGSTNPTHHNESTSVGSTNRYRSPGNQSITGGGGHVGSQNSYAFPKLVNV